MTSPEFLDVVRIEGLRGGRGNRRVMSHDVRAVSVEARDDLSRQGHVHLPGLFGASRKRECAPGHMMLTSPRRTAAPAALPRTHLTRTGMRAPVGSGAVCRDSWPRSLRLVEYDPCARQNPPHV